MNEGTTKQRTTWKYLKHLSCCQVPITTANMTFLPHEGALSFDSSFLNDSGYETRSVIPLTSILFFFFFGVLSLYNDTLVSADTLVSTMIRWLTIFSPYFLSYSKRKKEKKPAGTRQYIWTNREWLNSIVRDRMSMSVKKGNVSQSGNMFWRTNQGNQTSMEKQAS